MKPVRSNVKSMVAFQANRYICKGYDNLIRAQNLDWVWSNISPQDVETSFLLIKQRIRSQIRQNLFPS